VKAPRAAATLLAAALLLAGCGSQPQRDRSSSPGAAQAWRARQLELSAIDNFSLQARLSETGLSATRADLRWQQSGERFDVSISGPLGVGALTIRGDAASVEIRSKEGVIATTEPERYMEEKLGWSLPLGWLRRWVLGLPAMVDGAPVAEVLLDETGRANLIRQDGWTIAYDEYQPAGRTTLPRKLAIGNGERRFRLVIDSWMQIP
jgi:outer membrane lipoprotein LolB